MPELVTGAKFNIGTAPIKLVPHLELKLGRVIILAPSTNTDIVYIGPEGLDAGATEAKSGFPLSAGGAINLTDIDLGKFWVVAASGTQKLFWIGT